MKRKSNIIYEDMIVYCKYLLIDNNLPEEERESLPWTLARYSTKTEEGYLLEDGGFANKKQVLREVIPQNMLISDLETIKAYLKENDLTQIENSGNI